MGPFSDDAITMKPRDKAQKDTKIVIQGNDQANSNSSSDERVK